METFSPSTNVAMTVKMTKTMYAQLVSQQFFAPRAFTLPPAHSRSFKAYELGMKVVCVWQMEEANIY